MIKIYDQNSEELIAYGYIIMRENNERCIFDFNDHNWSNRYRTYWQYIFLLDSGGTFQKSLSCGCNSVGVFIPEFFHCWIDFERNSQWIKYADNYGYTFAMCKDFA